MTRSFGFILGAMAGCMFLLFAPSALHAQTMGEYGTALGSQTSTQSPWKSMSAGSDARIGSGVAAMSRGGQPAESARTIDIPRGAVRYRTRSKDAARGNASDDPSTHEWVRVR